MLIQTYTLSFFFSVTVKRRFYTAQVKFRESENENFGAAQKQRRKKRSRLHKVCLPVLSLFLFSIMCENWYIEWSGVHCPETIQIPKEAMSLIFAFMDYFGHHIL